MLDFAIKVSEASVSVADDDMTAMRRHGWSDEDILHITEIAAMFNFTGRLANTLGWIANPEYGDLGRAAAPSDGKTKGRD